MAIPFCCSRTMIEFESAWTTSALSQFESFGLLPFSATALMIFTTIGTAILATSAACARAGVLDIASIAASASDDTRILEFFIDGDLQRLQKLDILWRDFDLCFRVVLVERFFVHPNMQRFQEAAVL